MFYMTYRRGGMPITMVPGLQTLSLPNFRCATFELFGRLGGNPQSAEAILFFSQEPVNFAGEFRQPFWVLFVRSQFSKFHPPLTVFLHKHVSAQDYSNLRGLLRSRTDLKAGPRSPGDMRSVRERNQQDERLCARLRAAGLHLNRESPDRSLCLLCWS
jgi:hypothetical protein